VQRIVQAYDARDGDGRTAADVSTD
jgi:hypothetical protein